MSRWDLDVLPDRARLLTVGNPKTAKSEGEGWLTAILHLAPASLSGRNVCPHATAGCRVACLNTAGRGGIALDGDGLNPIQVARIRRTRWLQRDRSAFMAAVSSNIEAHIRRAARHGLSPAVRLNGTSDLPWERLGAYPVIRGGVSYPNVYRAFPEVRFYDYTKWPRHLRGERKGGDLPANYALTFSLADGNSENAIRALRDGLNVAVVFSTRKGAALPDWWQLAAGDGRGGVGDFIIANVVDGDRTDLRFLDPTGVVVGLRAKGRAINDRSGFVRAA